MAEAYETEAFEEVYKHPDWKFEAETFETDFTKALYDDEAVKKEGQKALVRVSNILLTYNRVLDIRKSAEDMYSGQREKIEKAMSDAERMLEELKAIEASGPLDEEQKEQKKELEDGLAFGKKELTRIQNEIDEKVKTQGPSELRARDDEGQILSSLMLGGTGIGGQGYTLTDNSIQDTRKGAKYIREQMTEKGSLIDQMALLDNAMNTGGVDLEGGTDLTTKDKKGKEENHHIDFQSGDHLRKGTLSDFFRDKNADHFNLTADYLKEGDEEGVNREEIKKFQGMTEEEQNNLIGEEGAGANRQSIMDVARSRTMNDEAKMRKGQKATGIKGAFKSVKNFFTGGDSEDYVGPLSLEEKKQKEKEEAQKQQQEKPKEGGIKGVWNSVKNFFTGGDKSNKPKPFEIDYDNLTDSQREILTRQGLDPNTVKSRSRIGMSEAQKRALARVKYMQRKDMQDKAARNKGLFVASGNVNQQDTSAKMEEMMNARDRAIARELNDKKFLTTEDAMAVVKDPNAQTGRLMNSSKSARNMLAMYKMMTSDEQSLLTFRLALLAYLVPTRRNTIYEVLSQSQDAGLTGKEDLTDPARMYETISPYTKDEIRQKLPGKKQFPHEKVFMTMLNEYNELRADARGTKKEDRKDLVENQKEMSVAEVARELLNPASGLGLFARLRLLTDESITDADIKKHIDRLDPKEQDLVNEFIEKMGREQTIKFEDLKKWIQDNEKEIKELDEQLETKQKELTKVMLEIRDVERDSSRFDRNPTRELDQKSRGLEREIQNLQERRDKAASERKGKEPDYNERVDWKNEREAQAVTAVNKIRKDLFHLLTATPTAYETDLEATVPALRNRLLVITRLANRFLLDKFEETPEFEDKYKFKEYNPDREEVYQSQLKEEKAGTLGMSQATKDEIKRKEEEEKARIAAEKEMRSNLAQHCFDMMSTVQEDERLLPESLEDEKAADAKTVGMAIGRVINTYLNFDPSIAGQMSDVDFPELIPRLMRYTKAATQIEELLKKRGDVNGALTEANLHTIRRALKLRKPIENLIEKRYALYTKSYFSEHTGKEYQEKMDQVRNLEEGAEGKDITEEQKEMFDLVRESEAATEELSQASRLDEEDHAPYADNGRDYLNNLQMMKEQLHETEMENDPNPDLYNAIALHTENLYNALSGTFNEETDIPAEAVQIAALFGVLEAACNEYVKKPAGENNEEEEGGTRNDPRAFVVNCIGDMTKGMFQGFTAAAYKTVDILSKNNVFRKEDHLWARVMVLGVPKDEKGERKVYASNNVSGRPKLESLDEDALTSIKRENRKDKTNSNPESRSLNRFRALLGSADMAEMKKTMETYERWNEEDEQHREKMEELEEDLDKEIQGGEEEEEEEEREEEEKKTPEEQEIDKILADQEAENIAAKEGEEDVVLENLRNFNTKLGSYKTGFLGLLADKKRNEEVAELQKHIGLFIELLTKPVLKMLMADETVVNDDELEKEYFDQMVALAKKAKGISFYAFCRTGADAAEEQADPFKGLCRSIHKLFKKYRITLESMLGTTPQNVIRSSAGADLQHKKEKRYDISEYAMKQNQEGKLRYIFFLIRGGMTKGETGYAAPEKWQTKEKLQLEIQQKKQEEEEKKKKEAQKSSRFSINDTGYEDEEDEDQDEIVDFNRGYSHLPGLDELEDEDEEEPAQNDDEKVNKQLQKLEKELEEGEYEDAEGEHQLKPDQKLNAKVAARLRAIEDARRAIESQKEKRATRREERKKVALPTYQNIRAKERKSKDDFAISGGPVENRPTDIVEVDIEQTAVRNRNFVPQMRMGDKVAKAAGWTLFGALHYIGKPVKWLGNGVVKGVNFALRWVKKKKNGSDSMQKTSKIATQEKQDQIANEIEAVKSGRSDQPVNADTSRVPMNWAVETAEDPKQDPTVTVGASAEANADQTDFIKSDHAWMRINYTKQDPQTGKAIRSRIDLGYGPRGGFTLNGSKGGTFNAASQVADGALMPGALWDERGRSFAAAKTYRATNQQINQILLEAERYPAGGFNVITRNCTTFVAETTQNAGVNTGDILQKVPLRLGAKYLAVPLLSLLSPVTKALSSVNANQKSEKDDLSFQRYGEKQVTEDELVQMGKDNGVQTESYTPMNTLQAIQEEGGELNALHNAYQSNVERSEYKTFIQNAGTKVSNAIKTSMTQRTANQFARISSQAMRDYETHLSKFSTATPEEIMEGQKIFSAHVKAANNFFYQNCQGKAELRIPFLNFIGVLNRTKMVYDEAFREARTREKSKQFEGSDISGQLKALTSGKTQKYMINTKEGLQEMNSSPSLMIGYAKRGTSVGQSFELQQKNQGKERLLDALDRSVDVDTADIWQKESFSEEDTDLAFGTMQEQQESISHNKMEYDSQYDFTGAEVMQAMIFERIYAGMKGRISAGNWFAKPGRNAETDVETYNKRSKQFFSWLKQDIEISSKSHPQEVQMIQKSIGKRLGLDVANLDANGMERIQKEYRARFVESYLVPLLAETIKEKYGTDQYFSVYGMIEREYLGM